MSALSIAVSGAGGFVGASLAARLERAGHRVTRLARATADLSSAPLESLTALLAGSEVVLHLAARAHVMVETAADPLAEFRRVNVGGSERLAQAALRAGVRRFVFVSTVGIHGETTTGQAFTASDPAAPASPYAVSKWEAEQALARLPLPELVIVRPPLVYGPGVHGNFRRLLGLVSRGLPLPFAALDERRSYIGLDNLCDLLATCARHPGAPGGRFLVADGQDLSVPELVMLLGRGLGTRVRLLRVPLGLLRIAAALAGRRADFERLAGSLRVDATATVARLDWRAAVTPAAGLLATGEWYRRESCA